MGQYVTQTVAIQGFFRIMWSKNNSLSIIGIYNRQHQSKTSNLKTKQEREIKEKCVKESKERKERNEIFKKTAKILTCVKFCAFNIN